LRGGNVGRGRGRNKYIQGDECRLYIFVGFSEGEGEGGKK